MATDLKHEAELDDSTIKGEEESSMYHILKGWPIIIAHLRKESKELEKNSETKSKSTIAKTTFDMTVDQAISGLNRKTKPEYSNLSKQGPTLTSATRHRTSNSGECQRAIQSSYYSYE